MKQLNNNIILGTESKERIFFLELKYVHAMSH